MADVSKIFKPRRGTKSIMAGTKKSTVLASGEFFVEVPDAGVGKGASKIKIGDGTTAYSSLPYALGDTSNDQITFSSNTSTTVAAALNSVTSGGSLKNIVAGLKQAISLCNTSITQLNDDTSKIKTYVGTDGKLHFVNKAGADSVLNFSSGGSDISKAKYMYGNGTSGQSSIKYTIKEAGNYLCCASGTNWSSSSGSNVNEASIISTKTVIYIANNIRFGNTASSNGGTAMSVAYIPNCVSGDTITCGITWTGNMVVIKV